MTIVRFAAACLAWITLVSCSSLRTYYDYDREADFSALRTYDWIDPDSGSAVGTPENDLVNRRIRAAVDRELAAQGYVVATADPDFLVTSHVGVEQRIEVHDWGYSYGRSYGRHGMMVGSTDVREYDEGTLILDVIDAETRNLIWRGTAKRAVSRNPTPEESEAIISTAVAKILDKFPPGD